MANHKTRSIARLDQAGDFACTIHLCILSGEGSVEVAGIFLVCPQSSGYHYSMEN